MTANHSVNRSQQTETENAVTAARWFVLQSKPRQERRALENLRNQGYECLLPLYSRERLRRGKRERVEEPLFPRYLFVHLNEVTSNWYALRSTYGVTHIVRFGDTPAVLDDAIVQTFVELQPADRQLYQPGDTVHIFSGPFAGLDAIYQEDDGEARAIFLLDFMSKQQRVSFPVAEIQKRP